jgi:hypothetical protein
MADEFSEQGKRTLASRVGSRCGIGTVLPKATFRVNMAAYTLSGRELGAAPR